MRRVGNERGQTLLEYTVVILTVLTVIFGVFETARLMLTYTTLAEAARAGARYAIVHGADCTGACVPDNGALTAQNVAGAAGITLDSYTAGPNPPARSVPGTLLTVTVTYTFVPVTPLVALGIRLSSTTESMIVY
jgi:Flp pilus assembly protein TadG